MKSQRMKFVILIAAIALIVLAGTFIFDYITEQ